MRTTRASCRQQLKGLNSTNYRSDAGMTIIELLVAISLFATFMSIFVVVTQMLVTWIPETNSPSNENQCNGQGLETQCINAAFDRMVESLELAPYSDVDQLAKAVISDECWHHPKGPNIYNAGDMPWPDSYRVCLVKDPGASETDPSLGGRELPGLYLLQASPVDDAHWRKPVQRLLCRPIHLCIKDQSLP